MYPVLEISFDKKNKILFKKIKSKILFILQKDLLKIIDTHLIHLNENHFNRYKIMSKIDRALEMKVY